MATYKGISGFNIKSLSSDPSNLVEGEIWYNSTSGTLKVAPLVESWASGGNIPSARGGSAFAGTQTAGALFGGRTSVPTTTDETKEYNGTSWTAGGTMTTARLNLGGCGTQTAALASGGSTTGSPATNTDACEEYNGASWTAGGTISSRRYLKGCGTQTAGLITGGYTTTAVNVTEEYNGASWTAGGANTFTKYFITNSGTQTAALGFSGAPAHTATNSYNGTSWTAVPATINTERADMAAAGIQTAALAFGGFTPPGAETGATESYDGSTWTTSPGSLGTARTALTGGGTSTVALAAGGGTTSSGGVTPGVATEEFSIAATAKTITTS